MRGDNIETVPPWVWDKTWTAADPLSVDEEPRTPPAEAESRGAVVGLVMLLLAFLAGVVVGWWLG